MTLTEAARAQVFDARPSRWVNGYSQFDAELNRRRAEVWDGALDELRGLLPMTIGALRDSLSVTSPPATRLRAA